MAMRAVWIRVVRGVGIITGPATRQRSLGTRPLAPASGRLVVRVIPTVQEAMARVQTVLIPIISSKSVCFTLNPIHRRACGLLIAGALVLLSIVGVVRVPSPLPPIPDVSAVKEIPNSPPRLGEQPRALWRARFHSSDLLSLQSDFYRTIIDNNLFRPLGWTPPRPIEPYRLIGEPETYIRRDHTPTSHSTIHHRTSNIYRDIRLKPRRGHRSGRHPVKTGDTLHAGAAPHTNATDRFLTSLGETPTSRSNEGAPTEQCW